MGGKWDIQDNPFCESLIYGHPEYVNSFTSLIIFFVGIYLLFMTKCANALIRIVSASIAITGIGSFIFHWTLWKSAGLLDTVPMLLAAYLATFLCLDLIIFKYIKIDKQNTKLYQILSNLFALLILSGLYPAIMVTAIDSSNDMIFDILFAIPNVIIIISILFMKFYTFDQHYGGSLNDVKKTFCSILFGLSLATFSAIIWFITELNCDEYDWMKYTFAHGLWHIGMSVGYYQLITFFIYMNALIRDKNPEYKKGNSKLEIYLYYILPVITIPDKKESRELFPIIEEV